MKIKILQVDDTLLIGLILLIGTLFYSHAEISLFLRITLVLGILIAWLICEALGYVFIKYLWKKRPGFGDSMERNYDERAQVLIAKARTYAGRLLQIMIVLFSLLIFAINNDDILISFILLILCGAYNLSFYVIKKHLEKLYR
jgi:hypothetical protein